MFLLKSLYGSATAPFQFNCYLANSLLAQGFTPNEYDCCLFTKVVEGSIMMVLCYVDDSASVHINSKVIDDCYAYCGTPAGGSFKFGTLEKQRSRFLGFDIQRDPSGFILTQIPLIEKIFNAAKKHMSLDTWDQPTTTPIAKDTSLNDDKPMEVTSMSASMKTYLLQFPYREIQSFGGNWVCGTWHSGSSGHLIFVQISRTMVVMLRYQTLHVLVILQVCSLSASMNSIQATASDHLRIAWSSHRQVRL